MRVFVPFLLNLIEVLYSLQSIGLLVCFVVQFLFSDFIVIKYLFLSNGVGMDDGHRYPSGKGKVRSIPPVVLEIYKKS